MSDIPHEHRSAFIALVGRPNSGKSTLLNTMLGETLAVVTPLPQTTRRTLRGIYSEDDLQLVFIDTPGIHEGRHEINDRMVHQSRRCMLEREADIVGYVVDCARPFGSEDDMIADMVRRSTPRLIIVFNKTDLCAEEDAKVREFFSRYPSLVPSPSIRLSAPASWAKKAFLDALRPLVPTGPRYFADDDCTDANLRFFAAEYIREQIILTTREEVPHATCVEISVYHETPDRHRIEAVIHVETRGQKGIIIGESGKTINRIEARAARNLSRLTGCPVSIRCHVRHTPQWRNNINFLSEMGFPGPKEK